MTERRIAEKSEFDACISKKDFEDLLRVKIDTANNAERLGSQAPWEVVMEALLSLSDRLNWP